MEKTTNKKSSVKPASRNTSAASNVAEKLTTNSARLSYTASMSVEQVKKGIEAIGKRGRQLDQDIQMIALSIIAHVEKHGDTTLADSLYNAMPKSSKRNALASWFVAFGRMRILDKKKVEDKQAIAAGRCFQYAKEKTTDFDGAADKHWYDMTKQDKITDDILDVASLFESLVKRVKKAVDEGKKIDGLDALKDRDLVSSILQAANAADTAE